MPPESVAVLGGVPAELAGVEGAFPAFELLVPDEADVPGVAATARPALERLTTCNTIRLME